MTGPGQGTPDPGYPQTPNPLPAPFLTADQFAALWRPLSTSETQVATLLLQAAAVWIVERKPTISQDDPMAKVVCLDVVREALTVGKYAGMKQFSRTVGQRMESGTIADVTGLLDFTAHHRELLGIGGAPAPAIGLDAPCRAFADPALPSNMDGSRIGPAGWYW